MFLYNNTDNLLIFNDVGLEIEGRGFFQLSPSFSQFYFDGCSIDNAIDNTEILLLLSDEHSPPLIENIIDSNRAKFILSKRDSAFEIHYFDDNTNLNANNIQDAVEKINQNKISEAPDNNKLYGRRNKQWMEVEVFSGNSPSGSNGDVQFNTDDVFDSSGNFNYDRNENKLLVSGFFTKPINGKVGLWVI